MNCAEDTPSVCGMFYLSQFHYLLINYFSRALRPDQLTSFAKEFDAAMDTSIATAAECSSGFLPAVARRVRGLPRDMGGLGIRRMEHLTSPANVAAAVKSLQYIQKHFPLIFALKDNFAFDPQVWRKFLPESNQEETSFDALITPILGAHDAPSQKDLLKLIDAQCYKVLVDSMKSSVSPRIKQNMMWLESAATPATSQWLDAAIFPDPDILFRLSNILAHSESDYRIPSDLRDGYFRIFLEFFLIREFSLSNSF